MKNNWYDIPIPVTIINFVLSKMIQSQLNGRSQSFLLPQQKIYDDQLIFVKRFFEVDDRWEN